MNSDLSVGQCATLACLLEVAAPKPGNVHRAADFPDACLQDFLASAVAIGPAMEMATQRRVGATVLAAMEATGRVTQSNTNLGIVLLIAPLAAVPRPQDLFAGVENVLSTLNRQDAADVYQAIRHSRPGGMTPQDRTMRPSTELDIQEPDPGDLLAAMRQAAAWDAVARQYASGYHDLSNDLLPWLIDATAVMPLSEAIVLSHVRAMSRWPDTLIARKCGITVAEESSARATAVLESGPPGSEVFLRELSDLDFWLRCDGNRRNPGASADLVTAALFVALRDCRIQPPYR